MWFSDQRHDPASFYPRESTPGTHWLGGCVALRAGLNTEARGKILCLYRDRAPVVQSVVKTLYRLSSRSSITSTKTIKPTMFLWAWHVA
jgi:hypothetical protein